MIGLSVGENKLTTTSDCKFRIQKIKKPVGNVKEHRLNFEALCSLAVLAKDN